MWVSKWMEHQDDVKRKFKCKGWGRKTRTIPICEVRRPIQFCAVLGVSGPGREGRFETERQQLTGSTGATGRGSQEPSKVGERTNRKCTSGVTSGVVVSLRQDIQSFPKITAPSRVAPVGQPRVGSANPFSVTFHKF